MEVSPFFSVCIDGGRGKREDVVYLWVIYVMCERDDMGVVYGMCGMRGRMGRVDCIP